MGIERLFAGLVPEDAAPRISPQRPAEEGEQQQSRFRDAVLPALRLGLVQPERRKGDDVDRDEGGGNVGGGEEVGHGRNLEPIRRFQKTSNKGHFILRAQTSPELPISV